MRGVRRIHFVGIAGAGMSGIAELLLAQYADVADRILFPVPADPADDGPARQAIERLRAAQMQLAEAGSKRLAEALADAAEVLTPAQRTLLAERIAHRRRRWH